MFYLLILGLFVAICCSIISSTLGGSYYYMNLPVTAPVVDGKSKWNCMNNGNIIREVDIWWGHTATDATYACNDWEKTTCAGNCKAVPIL